MIKDEENLKLEEPLLLEELMAVETLPEEVTSRFDFIYERIERWQRFYYRLTQGSTSGSVFCLLCLTFGSGILALPFSFTKSGIVLGTILFLFASFCAFWMMRLITNVAFSIGKLNYSHLIYKYYGKNQVILFDVMNVVANFGAILVYQQIISNFFLSFLNYCGVTIIQQYPKLTRFIQMNLFCVFTQIPLSLVKDVSILHKVSLYGTLALLYTVIVALIEFPFYFKANFSPEKILLFKFDQNVIKILCMYYFAYANHNAVLHVLNEVRQPSKEKGNKIVKYSFIVEFVTYTTVLFSGYLSTFDQTKEIFIDREGQSVFLVVGKALYIISLTCHIGLYYFISRPSVEMMINQGKRFTDKQNFYSSVTILFLLNLMAFYFTSISNVISLIGATADIYFVFILPVMLYLKYKPKRDWKRYLSISMMSFSVLIGALFLLLAFTTSF